MLGLSLLALGACSAEDKDQLGRLAMPAPASDRAPAIFDLWKWSWVAAMVVGVLTWGLMFYAAWRFRRSSKNLVPVQTRYNLPLEIFYTIAPILMVIVFFFHTVNTQNTVLEMKDDPDLVVDVVGQQWSWTFNYSEQGEGGTTPYVVGTTADRPKLVLPVDRTVEFRLHSPDVIHSFMIDAFLMKMDVIPGRVNEFQATPTKVGEFRGKCFELCGVYHSRMLFDVEVVSGAEYDAYLAELQENPDNVAKAPVLGGSAVNTQPGLDDGDAEGDHQ
ncbi:aa3-type cytochrome oxidase subunit II [Nocardioides daphniae]|uniref:aa3-type cytochrome oxidase subunit II n=1 Tax=Nocardioides daphniae TaxID=402297 RepID=UPI003FCEA740